MDVWMVIQNGNSKKRISNGNDGDGCNSNTATSYCLSEIKSVEKDRKSKDSPQILLQCSQMLLLFHQSKCSNYKVKSGYTGAYSTCTHYLPLHQYSEKDAIAGFADESFFLLFANQIRGLGLAS
ncbi:hypothetical protein Tco_0480596 [Tanacetum coccineum]